MAQNKDFIVKNGLVVQAQGSSQSTSTTTGAIVTPGGIGVGGNLNVAGTLIAQGVDLLAFDDHVIYVSDATGNDTTGDGRRVQSAYRTVKYALNQATFGDTVYIEAGTYVEQFPMTVPDGVSVRGAGIREVFVKPTEGTKTNDAFLLGGDTTVSDLTVGEFFQPGYAFKYTTGAKILRRSPYIQRITVLNKGSTISSADPYGFVTGDAGGGCYFDSGVLDPTSIEPAVLFNEATFIVPNAVGLYLTNGTRVELINAFFYFADKAIFTEIGALGYGGVGKTKLKLSGVSGIFTPGDTLIYKSNTGTTLATATIGTVSGGYIFINGPAYGFETFVDAGTSTQVVYTTGTNAATATSIILADFHQFGAEIRSIGSAANYGNQGVIADGTGTDLQLIAFNFGFIGSGGDFSNDSTLVSQINEVIQTNGGRIFYQSVDQAGDFRVGDQFIINQRTGDVSFGNSTVNLTTLTNLTITDGSNTSQITPTSIRTGNLTFSGNTISSLSGDVVIDPSGPSIVLNGDTRVQGPLTATNIVRLTSLINATNSSTGALQIDGGMSVDKDIWLEGSINVRASATIVDLYVTGNAIIPGGFTATSFTSTELTIVGPSVLNQLTAALTTLTQLTVTGNASVNGTLSVSGTSVLSVVTGTNATFNTLVLNSTTNAISTTSGVLQVRGGVGIGRDLYVGGSTFLQGDLFVDGNQFTVNSTNLNIGDKTITLSSATAVAGTAIDSGILVGQAAGGFVSFLYNGIDSWRSKGSIIPNGTANLGATLTPWNVIRGNSIFDNANRVITNVTPTAGLGIAITDLTSGGPNVVFAVTNTGVLSIVAGTDTAVSTATGVVSISLTSTLQSVTGRGSATNRPIQLTAGTAALSQTTGTLVVTGGVGISGALYAGNMFSNGSAVWSTATLTNNNQLSNGAGYLTSSTLGDFGVSAISAGVGIRVSQSTGTVTVTNIGVVSLAGTQFIGISASSGSNIAITNLGVQQAVAGSGITVSNSTGSVTITSADTLQLVTARGATTNQPVAFTATNLSASTSSGQALLVSGGVGALAVYATNVFDSGNRVLTSVAAVGGNSISISAISTGSGSTTFTVNNTGVTATIGTTYLGVSTATGAVTFTNLGVQTLTAGSGTAVSASTGQITVSSIDTLQLVTNRGSTTTNAVRINNATATTSTNTGALIVQGGVGVNGSIFIGGSITVLGVINASTVAGSIDTATNIASGATGSIPYQESTGRTRFIGIGSTGSLLQSNGTTATYIATSSIHVGVAQFAISAQQVVGGNVIANSGTFNSNVVVLSQTASTSTTTGALTVAGGVGVVGSIYAGEVYDSNSRVITSIIPTAGPAIGISSLVSNGPLASFAISNLGVQTLTGSEYLAVDQSTGTVTITNNGVQTISGTSYLGASSGTGTVTLTNLGVQTLTAGTDTAVSQSTGTVTVWTTSTLQSVTNRGAVTSNPIAITNTLTSTSPITGALAVTGGVGVGENLNVAGTMSVTGAATFRSAVNFLGTATFVYSTNTYFTDNLLDLHTNPAGVGTRWVNDDGQDIGFRFNYFNRTLNTGTVGALYLDNTSQWLEWYNAGSGGTSPTDIWFTGTSFGSFRLGAVELRNTTVSSSTLTGALVVYGGGGIGGNLYVGGTIFSAGAQVITAATLGAFGVSQILAGPAISVSPGVGTGTVTIGNLGVRSLTAGSGIAVSTSTGSVIIQSIDTLQLVTDRGFTTTNEIFIANATGSTSINSGALRVAGGAAVSENLFVGGGLNVTGISTFTNFVTGRISTASNILGGTAGSLPYQFASGDTRFIGIGIVGSVLTSDGATPTYQSTQSLVVGFANRAITATNITAGLSGQVPYQTGIGATAFTGGSGTEGNVLVSRGSGVPTFQNTLTLAGTTQATNTLTGALQVRGGVGIGRDLYVGGTAYIGGSQIVTAANLGQFGVAQIVAGQAIGISPSEGTGTVTITNFGVQSITTSSISGIAISSSTGTISIASIDTFQLVTARGPTTNQPIAITATNLSSTTGTGQALLVSGGIGALAVYASNLYDSGNRVITSVFPAAGNGISVTSVNTSNGNMSFTINNTGVTSLAGASFIGVSAATGAVQLTNLGVTNLNSGTDITLSATTGSVTINAVSTLQSVTNRGATTTNALSITNATASTSTETGALTIVGGIGVRGDIYARNIYTNGQIVGGQTSTSTNISGGTTGAIVYQEGPGVTGFIGIGPSGTLLVSNGSTATWQIPSGLNAGLATTATNLAGGLLGSIPYQTAAGITRFISVGPIGSLLRSDGSTASYISTSSLTVGTSIFSVTATNIAVGAAGQILYQSAVGQTSFVALGVAGTVLVSGGSGAPTFQSTLTLESSVQATSTATGALQVRGGLGVGGNVWVGGTLFASIDGTISTATNIFGGTAGALVYQDAVGRTRFIGIGANGTILQSNGTTATYVTTSSLLVGSAVSAGATNNLGGGGTGSIPYQTALNNTAFIGIGPSTSLLQSNGTTATWATTASITVQNSINAVSAARIGGGAAGAIPYQAATGITAFINIGPAGTVLTSDGSTASWITTGSTLVGAAQNLNAGQAGFIPFQESPGVTRFIGTGTRFSLLQMGANTATFVSTGSIIVGRATNATSSENANTINGGSAGQILYQSATGNTAFVPQGIAGSLLVAGGTGAPLWQNTLTLASTLNAISTQSGAFVVQGGVGIAKDLWVGGVLYATVQGSINTATNLNGGVAGSLPIQDGVGSTTFIPIGVAGTMLRSNGSTLQYVTTTSLHVGTADNASGVVNIAGGSLGSIPYQTGIGVTRFIGIGPNGSILQSNGTTSTWVNTGTLVAGVALRAVNIAGGSANQVPFQSAPDTTAFSTNLTFNGTSLTVAGNVSAAAFVPTSGTVPTNGLYLAAANTVAIAAGGTNELNITTTGLGVGKLPTVSLDVAGEILGDNVIRTSLTTNATNATSGALRSGGGLGVVSDAWIGGTAFNTRLVVGGTAIANNFTATIVAGPLTTAAGDQARALTLTSSDANSNFLEFSNHRAQGGASWTTGGFRMQQKVDSTWMGWMQFNGGSVTGTTGGITWGTGALTASANAVPEQMRLDVNGNLILGSQTSPAGSNGLFVTGNTRINGITTASRIFLNREGEAGGISWYSPTFTSWSEYMAPAGATNQGPTRNITAPSGTFVTSWARRSYVENPANYGWTFESGSASQVTPVVRFEIRSSDGRIWGGNDAYFAGDVYTSFSDIRLKDVKGVIENPLDKLREIDTFYYEANELAVSLGAESGRKIGVSAQSVLKVLPEVVSASPLNKEYLTVQYEKMVPLLIESIKELERIVKDQQEQINQLKGQ
jgi:hypothetical protein